MEIRAEEISQVIREQIKDYEKKMEVSETGTVLSVGDGVASILLTTPVAHLTSLPKDPFRSNGDGYYSYACRYLSCWILHSWGPDNDDADAGNMETEYVSPADPGDACNWDNVLTALGEDPTYDPTNGTTSKGSVIRTGP